MAANRIRKILEKIGAMNVEEAWKRGEPIDDGAAKCDWLEALFDDIPRLRENGGMLIVKTGEEFTCFEDTKSSRREWLNLIVRAIIRMPGVAIIGVDDTESEDRDYGYYEDPEPDNFEDLDRPVAPEPVLAARARRSGW